MNLKYIDIHCHLDFSDYGEELPKVLDRMREREVGAITIGTDLESSRRAVEIAEQNENIWACIGVHPDNSHQPPLTLRGGAEQVEVGEILELEKLIKHPKVVAVGECGLDFFRTPKENLEEEKGRQTILFKKQIELALKYDKSLMLHCRNAYDEVINILESYKGEVGEKLRGNCHFFAGNIEQAKRFLDLGFTMSFTGVITFPPRFGETSSHDYDEVVNFLPKGSIMSETDAPFVAPVPHRGKRNEPAFVVEVAKKIAEIRGIGEEEMRTELLDTANRVFGLSLQN